MNIIEGYIEKKFFKKWPPLGVKMLATLSVAFWRNEVLTEAFETKIRLQQDLGMKAILNSKNSLNKA